MYASDSVTPSLSRQCSSQAAFSLGVDAWEADLGLKLAAPLAGNIGGKDSAGSERSDDYCCEQGMDCLHILVSNPTYSRAGRQLL